MMTQEEREMGLAGHSILEPEALVDSEFVEMVVN